MVNQQTLEGNWNQIKGRLRERWQQLTEDDLAEARGRIDMLAGIIQRKTGEGREAIEDYLRTVSGDTAAAVTAAAETARRYAGQAAERFEDARKQAVDQIRAGYTEAERLVRDWPGVSLGICFAAGLLTGVLLVRALRRGDPPADGGPQPAAATLMNNSDQPISGPHDAERIQQAMQEVRGHLDEDVHDLLENARRMVDWRRHVRNYPWAALGAVVAVGFLLVPRRTAAMSLDADALAELARRERLVVRKTEDKGRVAGALAAWALAVATRGATAWLGRQAGQLLETWAAKGHRRPEQVGDVP